MSTIKSRELSPQLTYALPCFFYLFIGPTVIGSMPTVSFDFQHDQNFTIDYTIETTDSLLHAF